MLSASPPPPSAHVLRTPWRQTAPPRGPLTWLLGFTAADRDRWVSVVCGAGFAVLLWVDWIAV